MLKKYLPKTLFLRYFLIILTPIIVLQILLSVVFFDSLWIKTNKGLVNSLTEEINTVISFYSRKKSDVEFETIRNLINTNSSFQINLKKDTRLPKENNYQKFSFYDRLINEQLKQNINLQYWFNTRSDKDNVEIQVKIKNDILSFIVPKSRIRNSSGRIFILWITVPGFVLLLISVLFLRNQIKPIANLALSAEKFGKGQYVAPNKPSGPIEIRKATIEFEKMKARILRHISQRTTMLSGISHDLKTPLTRLKLQIEILNKDGKLDGIKEDINEMEKMISEYLDYSNSESNTEDTKFSLNKLLGEVVKKFNNEKINLKSEDNLQMIGKKHLLRRCFSNLIDNGTKYAENISITAYKNKHQLEILFDDDGPGIPESEHERVMRPFYKLDKSRNLKDGSVGLGLSIVQDIINSHGGKVMLENKKKGLRVKLQFPN